MARDDELEPLSHGITLNLGRGGGGLGGVAGIVVPIAVVGIIGIGAYVLYRKYQETMGCGTYEKLTGRKSCTTDTDCPSVGDRDFICKPCGIVPASNKQCVECGGAAFNVLNALSIFGTADAVACAGAQGRRVGSSAAGPKPVLTAGGYNPSSPYFPTDKSAESLVRTSPTGGGTEWNTYCPNVIAAAVDSVIAAKARNTNQGTGATYLETTCIPETQDGKGVYRAVSIWRLTNGEQIQTQATETPYEFAQRAGIPLSQLGIKDPGLWWNLQTSIIKLWGV
jgi:hypothetical protein